MKTYKHKIININDLIPYINNSRIHSDEQVNQVAASIKEFGFTNPVLVDEQGGIIAGHGRVMAAKKLGMHELPCIVLDGLTEAQKKAYVIADNQLALNATWDFDMLRLEVDSLQEMNFDIDVLAFDDSFFSSEEISFEPAGEEEQGQLDRIELKNVCCPKCNHVFDSRGNEC